jgi:hypothetical protein
MASHPWLGLSGGIGRFVSPILVVAGASGCMSQQLEFTARRTVNAMPDLHYQQVIDNLAKIASNPGFLPYLAVAGQGSVQVTDNGSSAMGLSMSPKVSGLGTLSLGASRNITGTWSLGTITSPDKIRSMQALYLHAIAARAAGDPAFLWFHIGGKADVPRHASYAGRYGDIFVWVMPDGIEGLSALALAVMDIATREDSGISAVADDGPFRGLTGPPGIIRHNFQVPPVGPVFTPGGH